MVTFSGFTGSLVRPIFFLFIEPGKTITALDPVRVSASEQTNLIGPFMRALHGGSNDSIEGFCRRKAGYSQALFIRAIPLSFFHFLKRQVERTGVFVSFSSLVLSVDHFVNEALP